MSGPDSTPPPSRLPPDPEVLERAERVNSDLMKFVRQVRTASPPVQVRLQQDMRERLEAERTALLGNSSVLPESLRHYAVTFTEVQWMLDAWIDATARNADDDDLKREFLDVATRMLGELEVLRQPDPMMDPPGRRPGWWSAITRGLRPGAPQGGPEPSRPGDLPDIII
jgi:hypothetical protein